MMKHTAIWTTIIMTLLLLTLNGCETFDKNLGILRTEQPITVHNNLFTSSFPELRLQISQSFKYLGSVQLNEPVDRRISDTVNDGDRSLEAASYLFGQTDRNNRLVKGAIIRLLVIQGNPTQSMPEAFLKSPRGIESSEMKILDDKYQYDLYADQDFLDKKEKELLAVYKLPSCALVKKLSNRTGLGGKSRVHILYFEDLSELCGGTGSCAACIDSARTAAGQKQFLKEFADRSFANIRFLQKKSIEDTTSRYVDAEPKLQPVPAAPPAEKVQPKASSVEKAAPAPAEKVKPAPPEKAAPAAEPLATEEAEKRLETLKRLYDKKLITKEDYEKKKAEILEGL